MMLFFTQYKNLIMLGALGILLILLGIQSYRINSYKADLAVCESQTKILSNSIELQNNTIKKQGEDAVKRQEASAMALKDAEKVSKARAVKLNGLNRLKTNPPSNCETAVKQAQELL